MHLAVPGAPDQTALPAGHPSMDMLTGATPSTQPAVLGSLSIQVVPGTAGGVVTPEDAVTVVLYHRGSPIKTIDLKLDAAGKAVVPGVPVMPPVQALVSVKHGGLVQQVVSPEMNTEQPIQSIQMKVFETTEEQPAWTVAMQHLIVQWNQDGSGAKVTEMLSVNSPSDRAWLGNKVGDGRVTMAVALPPQVDDVELGGSFDEDASKVADGKLVTGGAIFPGRSEYRITYTVAAKNGALDLPISAPAAVGNLIVFVPADDVQVTATGLTGGQPVDMGQGAVRMYRAQNLAPGSKALLSVTGIKPVGADPGAEAAAIKPSGFSARNVAMGGAFLIALIGAGMMLMKKNQVKKA